MSIREGQPHDIPRLVELDRASYKAYGANQTYFQEKFHSKNAKIIVTESNGSITGFVVFEIMEPRQQLEGFFHLNIIKPITEKWMHIIAFTTISNFADVRADSELLGAAEQAASRARSRLFCVPLSIDHPYLKNYVFGFWETNGYERIGTIKWIASPSKTIDCYFYAKANNL